MSRIAVEITADRPPVSRMDELMAAIAERKQVCLDQLERRVFASLVVMMNHVGMTATPGADPAGLD